MNTLNRPHKTISKLQLINNSKFLITIGIFITLVLGLSYTPASSTTIISSRARVSTSTRILVKFNQTLSQADKSYLLKNIDATYIETLPKLAIDIVSIPSSAAETAINTLSKDSRVAYAELDGRVQIQGQTNDYYAHLQNSLATIQAPAAWDIITANPGVKIAILDSGVQSNHEDLSGKVVAAANFTSDATPEDISGHGTMVAGIAAATANNTIGIAGVSYNAGLMSAKVVDSTGHGNYSSYINGIIWATDNGADVINMSLGQYTSTGTSALQEAVNYAWNKGVVIVAGAGNSGVSTPFYPAAIKNVIAVGGTMPDDSTLDYINNGTRITSNYGSWVDVVAPGFKIPTTCYSATAINRYCNAIGTSMSSPHVAGLAALLVAQHPEWTNIMVRKQLETNTDAIAGTGTLSQYGRINAYKAVSNPPAPMADLVVKRFVLTDAAGVEKTTFRQGERIYPKVLLANQGNLLADSSHDRTYTQFYSNKPNTVEANAVSDVSVALTNSEFGAGAAREYGASPIGPYNTYYSAQTSWLADATGNFTGRVNMNYDLKAEESTYSNNQLTTAYTVVASDTAVTNFQLTDSAGNAKTTFYVGESIFTKITVANLGAALPGTPALSTQIYYNKPTIVPLNTASDMEMYITHGAFAATTGYWYGSFPGGQYRSSFSPRISWSLGRTGTFTARAFSNFNGASPELNFANNQMTVTYKIIAR